MRLFPRSWRERYSDEVADHIAHSTRPVHDRLDLLMALAPVWADGTRRLPMPRTRIYTRTAAVVLSAIGVLIIVSATRELENGIAEVPEHWWSTAALLPLVAAALVLGLGELTARRTQHR
jgi:hypothetical protein